MVHPDRHRRITALEFSTDGSKILGSTWPDNNIQIWDAKSGAQLQLIDVPKLAAQPEFWIPNQDYSRLYTAKQSLSRPIAANKDGKSAYTFAFPDSCIQVWDTKTGELIDCMRSDPAHGIQELTGSDDAKFLLSDEEIPGTYTGKPARSQRLWNVETGASQILPSSFGQLLGFNSTDQQMVLDIPDNSQRIPRLYSLGVNIVDCNSLKLITKIDLPAGIHSIEGPVRFIDGKPYMTFVYRTYKQRNAFGNWNSTIACVDTTTGKTLGAFRYPIKDDSPLILIGDTANRTLVFSTWRASPAKIFGVTLPDLKLKWEVKLDGYNFPQQSVVFDNGNKIAVICPTDFDLSTAVYDRIVDWNLVPQNDLKIINRKDGTILETMTLPVGAETITKSHDGQSFAIGCAGAAYKIDLSGPFASESPQ